MAESAGGDCRAGPAAVHGHPPATTAPGSRGRRGACSPPRAARRCRGGGAGRTPGLSSAHPGDSGSPPPAGQGPPVPPCPPSAVRERGRVRALRRAFQSLQGALPAVPPGTKLSRLDVLLLATRHIAHLRHALGRGPPPPAPSRPLPAHPLLHPMKKWPMRSRLYAGPWGDPAPDPPGAAAGTSSQEHTGLGDSGLAAGEPPGVPTATRASTPAPPPDGDPMPLQQPGQGGQCRQDPHPHPARGGLPAPWAQGGQGDAPQGMGQGPGDIRGGRDGVGGPCPWGLGGTWPHPQQ